MADALSRFTIRASWRCPNPDRELGGRFRESVRAVCGKMDVDMTARDKGSNAWGSLCLPPSNSAFECPLPEGRLRRPPRMEMVGFVPGRLRSSLAGRWNGGAFRLAQVRPWSRRCPKLHPFETALRSPGAALLFARRRNGRPEVVLNGDASSWMVIKIQKCA